MFDPHYCQEDGGERLYAIGLELYRLTNDEDVAIPVIKAAADYGLTEAARFLARYWLGKTTSPEPHLSGRGVNYRKAAEFALACNDKELLGECFEKCSPGELDDIKARCGEHCKNLDTVRKVCVINQEHCCGDLCNWTSYTELRRF